MLGQDIKKNLLSCLDSGCFEIKQEKVYRAIVSDIKRTNGQSHSFRIGYYNISASLFRNELQTTLKNIHDT